MKTEIWPVNENIFGDHESGESDEEIKNVTKDSSDDDLETFLANENTNYSSEKQVSEEILSSS